jgi:hypothetical protein
MVHENVALFQEIWEQIDKKTRWSFNSRNQVIFEMSWRHRHGMIKIH